MNYFIAFAERSGSNFLCSLLRSTKLLGNPAEVLCVAGQSRELFCGDEQQLPMPIANPRPGWDSSNWERYYASYLRQTRTSNGVTGSKVSWRQWQSLVINLDGPPEVDRWIWLRRANKLRQAISAYRCLITSQCELFPNGEAALAPEFNGGKILQIACRLTDEDTLWEAFFRGAEPLKLWYEDLELDSVGAVRDVAKYLDVQIDLAPTSAMRRQSDATTEGWYERLLPEWQALCWR